VDVWGLLLGIYRQPAHRWRGGSPCRC